MYVIAGKKEGGFAAPEKLLDKAGNILRLGQYWDYDAKKWTGVAESEYKDVLGIGATAVDWDEDGDLDLVLGGYDGRLFLRMNEGSPTKHAFATESVMLKDDDARLEVPGRDAIPRIADWDGDGRFDILSGSGSGGAYWFRNVGTKGSPKFTAAKPIVEPNESTAEFESPTGPGERTQACAADYDGDGDLDLLVGDYSSKGDERHGWVWLFRRK